MNTKHSQERAGITLIEILMVIAILSVLSVLLIPQLRTVSKDRKIREAARKVGAIFAKASQNAVVDGVAGVYFERNQNFVYSPPTDRGFTGEQIRVGFATTTMYLMRAVPSWSGDFVGDTADVNSSGEITIPRPIDHDTLTGSKSFINPSDVIYLNNRSFGYRIESYVEDDMPAGRFPNGTLTLTVAFRSGSNISASVPKPEANIMVPFRVERLPRKVESSKVNLPDGYLVNLRYSGPVEGSLMYPETVLSAFTTTDDNAAAFYFGAGGKTNFLKSGAGIDTCSAAMPATVQEDFTPSSSLYFFVTEDDLSLEVGEDQLMDPENLWVTVGIQTGNVNVAYNIPQFAPILDPMTQEEDPVEFLTRLTSARDIAREKQTASQ